ncbi:site-2 protease family protein [Patescibacteria group bacterium]|nr:site-2 protease family protein [Patescibacteria group bacterium]MBU1967411.1 site-2 protease family protein [Patescibacteria group bacterium]MBU2543765.1 site-2 protease family protein [Patescibacteria group bacterium]
MLSLFFSNPLIFFILFPGLLLAITIHEFAHAWAADQLGDPTPRAQNRLTLDPRAHLDLLGTIAILLTRFGWGKPVQIDPYNLKDPVRDTALIALAGPTSNLIMAGILSIIINFALLPWELVNLALVQILIINVMLAIFNLVPIHPLDGGKILSALLPKETAYDYEQAMSRYGTMIIIFLIMPWNGVSPVSQLISPVINVIVRLLI